MAVLTPSGGGDLATAGAPGPLTELEPLRLVRRLGGRTRLVAGLLAAGLSLYGLYWVVAIVEAQVYRTSFLLVALVLIFLSFPAGRRSPRDAPSIVDWALVALAVLALIWPLVDRAEFPYRAATPTVVDVTLGVATILLVLEATRRTTGWMLTATVALFLVYAYVGPLLDLVGLGAIAHRGYYPDRLVGTLYMTLDGIFGVPLDVAATYIILFAVFGAVLERSGAGRFFIDWSLALMGRSRSPAAPGRGVTLAGFLLGTVSGSGVATTVTLGSVAWPLLRRAGYSPNTGGALLSAAGIGAILSPPTLGAAAFLIAEFLQISYLQVLAMAIIPMLLYYLSVMLMIGADARRLGAMPVELDAPSIAALTTRYGYHFLPLVVIAALMIGGMTPFRAVFWATALAIALSFVRAESALRPARLLAALEAGGRGVLPVVATTAAAGIVVGVVGLTGLGLKLAGLIVGAAGGSVLLTVLFAAVAIWVLGLALPVTASYIIGAVMIAPALVQVGIPAFAAHMFIFYYAVLSEVSPPTALSPFAASAITGGDPLRTTMLTWKYTLPAFLVPLAFTLSPDGAGLLLRGPFIDIARVTLTAAIGVGAFAVGLGGWLRRPATIVERAGAIVAGVLLVHPAWRSDLMGAGLLVAIFILHEARRRGG
ncbi:MAG TPA: TRAP transporter fused permease subunit [Gemmatimonadaceae bacterium]|nr:TRAP transporter fused permease subunit [Gemmatimonadaceae bacterium]